MKDKIQEGDVVNIFFSEGTAIFDAEVLYTPQATGDCWHIREKDGSIVYVQSFEMMRKVSKEGLR